MSLPSFTIVTASWNSERTIAATLDSVREQGYAGEVEHIVVDGGSTDATMEIVRAAGLRHVSAPDRGLTDALNKGIAMARGEIIGSLNSDDLYLPGALQRVGLALAAHPEVEWITGRCPIIDEHGLQIRRGVTRYKQAFLSRHTYARHLIHNYISAPATFARRSALVAVGGYDERFRYSADYDMWLKLGRRGDPIVLDAALATFRMAGESLSLTGFEAQFAEHVVNAREHGEGHRVAVALNQVASDAIVLAYRAVARVRARGGA